MNALTHGADTERLEQIATQLLACARRVEAVGDTGTACAPVLEEAWAGGDCEAFIGSWGSARHLVEQTETHLRAFAALLLEQAAQQEGASSTTGQPGPPCGGGIPGPRDPVTPGSAGSGVPGGRAAMLAGVPPQLTNLLSNSVIGRNLRAQYQAWSDSDMTYFERLFVPWGLPQPWRERYLDAVDGGTDRANNAYAWARKVGGPGDDLAISTLKGLSQRLSDWGQDAPTTVWTGGLPFALDALAGEVDSVARLAENPKAWWDDASSLDQAGLAVSLIPGAGIIGKASTKTAKEVIDLLTGTGRHVDDIPHDPPTPRPHPGAQGIEDLTRAVEHPDPSDPFSSYRAKGSQEALDILARHDVTDLSRTWDDVPSTKRGLVFEATEGGNLPEKFPVIDRVEQGADGMLEVTSTKTLDPTLKSYGPKFESTINGYVRDVAAFDGGRLGEVSVSSDTVGTRTLELVVRPDSLSPAQHEALERIRERAEGQGVKFVVKERP